MTYVAASIEIPTDPDSIWAVIGPFGGIANWLPGFASAELDDGGRIRRLHTDDGAVFVERLVTYDEPGRNFSYTITESPFDVTDHLAVVRVQAIGDGRSSRVDWTAAFRAAAREEEVRTTMQGVFDGGLAAVAKMF